MKTDIFEQKSEETPKLLQDLPIENALKIRDLSKFNTVLVENLNESLCDVMPKQNNLIIYCIPEDEHW